ncbi:TPA: hypothetical protein ACSP2A_001124 [Aeromonas hydrophila]
MRMINCGAYDCDVAIQFTGDVQISMLEFTAIDCNKVFNIDSYQQAVAIDANMLNVQNCGELMSVGQQATDKTRKNVSKININDGHKSKKMIFFESEQQAISRIANQYINSKNIIL